MSLINLADVVGRYRELAQTLDSTGAGSYHIPFAEAELNEKLSAGFTVPFSSNNLTAKDLCVDFVYARVYRYSNPEKVKTVLESLDKRVADLLAGRTAMITSNGDTIGSSAVADAIWASKAAYHPTFGMDDPEDQSIDSDRQQADYDARD